MARFYATPRSGTHSRTIDVRVLVDGKLYGSEILSIDPPATGGPARVELLRFYPRERLRLLDLANEGANVEIRSDDLQAGGIPLREVVEGRGDSLIAFRFASPSDATVTRSTWRKRTSEPSEQSGLRRIFAEQTFAECMNECQWVEEDCISYWNCHWDDQQCLGHCEQEEDQCEAACPCDDDPVLVDEYNDTETHVVSGPHGTVCAGNIFNPNNKAFYDEYIVFFRVKTYRVWEDCHGNRTTELVSTTDSSNRPCYAYSGQVCASVPGIPPPCVLS